VEEPQALYIDQENLAEMAGTDTDRTNPRTRIALSLPCSVMAQGLEVLASMIGFSILTRFYNTDRKIVTQVYGMNLVHLVIASGHHAAIIFGKIET